MILTIFDVDEQNALPVVTPPGPKKFLFVSTYGDSVELAWQLTKEGCEVNMYIADEDEKEVGDGFVKKIDTWKPLVDWADTIIFDDIGYGVIADQLRKKGKFVIGGSAYTDQLEMNRELGQTEMKSVGMGVLPHWEFDDFEPAIDFLKNNPARYVFKPSGEDVGWDIKNLLFIGQEEDGKDLVELLEHNKTVWSRKMKHFQIQKYASGVEVAVGAFFNGKEFITPININFEHKKLFPGDIGPSTGEMGCYDDLTEVLTRGGWKFFKDVTFEDEFATMEPRTNILEYHRPSAIVHYSHHKQMLHIKNRATDILVTPDHNMFGQEANGYRKKEAWGFVKAKNLPAQFVAPRTALWIGREEKMFTLPSCTLFHHGGKQPAQKIQPPIHILMDDWLSFLGIWIAEGSTSASSYGVRVAQTNPKKTASIEFIIKRMPFRFKKVKDGWKCYNKQLWSYLRPLGGALVKYVPKEYKELSSRQLSILFTSMCLGDGNVQKNGFRIYYTSSKILADDVQEILLKLGRVGTVKKRIRTITGIGDRAFKKTHANFEVIERIKKTVAWLDQRDTETVPYSGSVHCVEVPYHTLYVRRNGKPLWCGNTFMFWSQPNFLFRSTLEKMKAKLQDSGYIGYIDINCIANAKGIYPLEFTSRFGYPTLSIQLEGILGSVGDFLSALARGEQFDLKTKRGFQLGVVVAVPPFPYDDDSLFKVYKDSSILFKKPNLEGVRLGEVKLVDGDWRLAGGIGFVLVVTGSNSTAEGARKNCYRRIENIILQNMFYRTDIGERWHHDSDKLQTWGYLY